MMRKMPRYPGKRFLPCIAGIAAHRTVRVDIDEAGCHRTAGKVDPPSSLRPSHLGQDAIFDCNITLLGQKRFVIIHRIL